MISTIDRLMAAAISEARLQDALTERFAREVVEAIRLLDVEIARVLKRLKTAPNGRLIADRANVARALAMRADLLTAIEAAGYPDLAARAVDAPLDRLAKAILGRSALTGAAVRLTPMDVDALAALKQIRYAELLNVADDAGIMIWRAVLDGVLGARPLESLVDDIADVTEQSFQQARTVYDTAVSTYGRAVDQLHATGQPNERFLFAGPEDGKMRPFCRAHIGRTYTRAEIDNMDNGQLPNVMLSGGGYNCRHAWIRVSRLDDEEVAA